MQSDEALVAQPDSFHAGALREVDDVEVVSGRPGRDIGLREHQAQRSDREDVACSEAVHQNAGRSGDEGRVVERIAVGTQIVASYAFADNQNEVFNSCRVVKAAFSPRGVTHILLKLREILLRDGDPSRQIGEEGGRAVEQNNGCDARDDARLVSPGLQGKAFGNPRGNQHESQNQNGPLSDTRSDEGKKLGGFRSIRRQDRDQGLVVGLPINVCDRAIKCCEHAQGQHEE